jgi:hypothetical protein
MPTHRVAVLKRFGLPKDASPSLEELSSLSDVPRSILQEVYNRGIGAYKTQPTSVRLKGSFVKNVDAPMSAKLSKEQWAMARVYSFLNGNPKHDNDLRANLKGGAMDPFAEKEYPANYTERVLAVLKALSLNQGKKVKLVGSASQRSQLYAGDFDAHEDVRVRSLKDAAKRLQTSIKELRALPQVYIGDIKCGELGEFNPFRPSARVEGDNVIDFNIVESKRVVDYALEEKVVTPKDAKEAHALLDKATTPLGFLEARKEIRYYVLRWTPMEILEGARMLRDRVIRLEDAIGSGGLLKVDAVANIDNRFSEFSMISDVFVGGKRVTAPVRPLVQSLKEDILYYDKINPFKALKRFFALAKAEKRTELAKFLIPVMNSDLGRLYQIIGDCVTLLELLERPSPPTQTIRAQLDEMKSRFGSLYQLTDFLKEERDILGSVQRMLTAPLPSLPRRLESRVDTLQRKIKNA